MRAEYVKWVVLFATCLLMFGDYYAYDIPSAANKVIAMQEYLLMSEAEFALQVEMYYAVYSFPNIILPFFSGLFMDIFGVHRISIILSICVCLGQLIFNIGIIYRSSWTALFGRLLFGIGGESLGVAQSIFTNRWFSKTKHLTLALGLNLACGRLGSVVNDFVSPLVASKPGGVEIALWLGMATCLLSFGATLVLVWLETIYFPTNEISSQVEMTGIDHGIKTKSVKNPAKDSEKLISNVLFENFDLASSKSPTRKLKNSNADFNNNAETASIDSIEKPRHTNFYDSILTLWTDIKQLSRMYWLLCLIIIFSYGTVIPFNSIHAGFLVTKFNMDPVTAGQIMAIPEGLSMILVSFTGAWVDKYGYRMQILQVCGLLLAFVHFILGHASNTVTFFIPLIPLSILGICYSLQLTFWGIIPLLVSKEVLSTSYGLASSILNLSLTIFPSIVSAIIVGDPSYYNVELFFCGCGITCFILSTLLDYWDKTYNGHVLKYPTNTQYNAINE